jgi:hypothetical protein
VAFRIDQDAGTFRFDGSFDRGRGDGRFQFSPNRGFVSRLRATGIVKFNELSNRDLMNLAFGGFSIASARKFKELGFAPMTKEQMMDFAVQLVSPEYVSEMRALGVTETNTVDKVVAMRMFGVTPEFVRQLAKSGVRGLTAEELVGLRATGRGSEIRRHRHSVNE